MALSKMLIDAVKLVEIESEHWRPLLDRALTAPETDVLLAYHTLRNQLIEQVVRLQSLKPPPPIVLRTVDRGNVKRLAIGEEPCTQPRRCGRTLCSIEACPRLRD